MNHHKVLGLSPGATDEEIKQAYRKLALKLHPDRNPGDPQAEKEFKTVQEAYDALTKKQEPFFRQTRRRGRDVHAQVEISFLDAANGCNVTVDLRRSGPCPACTGTGAAETRTCQWCHGNGMMTYRTGNMVISSTCRYCMGRAVTVTRVCDSCKGDGVSPETTPTTVTIPAGVGDQTVMRLTGHGEISDIPGDAYVEITVKPHGLFARDGDDLKFNIPITYATAALGGEINIPTLSGLEKAAVTPGSRDGTEIRLAGKGLRCPQTGNVGDCVAVLKIDVPMPTSKTKKLLEKLAKLEDSESIKKYLDEINGLYGAVQE